VALKGIAEVTYTASVEVVNIYGTHIKYAFDYN
jgi:hypothetical protein